MFTLALDPGLFLAAPILILAFCEEKTKEILGCWDWAQESEGSVQRKLAQTSSVELQSVSRLDANPHHSKINSYRVF